MPLLFAAACSNSDNKSGSPDAAPTGSDAPAGSTFKVSGTATAQSIGASTAAAYIKIAAYASSDETTPVATTKADDKGNYTLELPVGVPLDGYLKATSDTTTAQRRVRTWIRICIHPWRWRPTSPTRRST